MRFQTKEDPMSLVRPAATSRGIAPITAPSIEALDRMTVNEKLAHFARKDAFKLPKRDGDRVARTRRLSRQGLPKNLTPGSIQIAGGHVTRQAYQAIGRPCFGIPTAKLLHGREYKVRLDGSLVFARCGECPIRSACDFVCDERLHVNEHIWEAFREFRRQGGREAIWSGIHARGRAAASALRDMLRHLQAAQFTTVADTYVAAHYDKKALQKQVVDAERQRQHRRQVQKGAGDPSSILSDRTIASEARLLHDNICVSREEEYCPRWLRQIDEKLVERVWAVRKKLFLKGERHGATHIARALAKTYPETTLGALRKRIENVLTRLPQLEALANNPSNHTVVV